MQKNELIYKLITTVLTHIRQRRSIKLYLNSPERYF
jgi:hypothetical protein